MGTRSVRLDDEAESALNEIIDRTGCSISDAIKEGLLEYRLKTVASSKKKPSDFFEEFDLGEGGYALAPAREAKSAVKDKLRKQRARP